MLKDTVLTRSESNTPSFLDLFSPHCRIVCAFMMVGALASVSSIPALLAGSVLPMLLLLNSRERSSFLKDALFKINKLSFFIVIFLPLTYPGQRIWGFVSLDGLQAALLVIWKLNLITLTFLQMVVAMGVPQINEALETLKISLKLRTLLLLTIRYILLLRERISTSWRGIHLRAPRIKNFNALHAFGCMIATNLIHSTDRAERSALAIYCRGGIKGFSQSRSRAWQHKDSLLCVASFLFLSLLLYLHFSFFKVW